MELSPRAHPARLIPWAAKSEARAASALLAVMRLLPDLTFFLLEPLKPRRGPVSTFVEVSFRMDPATRANSLEFDGIVVVRGRGGSWTAIVETKVDSNPLTSAQLKRYAKYIVDHGGGALVTISNQYVPFPDGTPFERVREYPDLKVHHLSWLEVLTQILKFREDAPLGHAEGFVLDEFIAFLRSEDANVLVQPRMGQSWAAVREGARERSLVKGQSIVRDACLHWDELVAHLALLESQRLQANVRPWFSRPTTSDVKQRLLDLEDELVREGSLHAHFRTDLVSETIRVCGDIGHGCVWASYLVKDPAHPTNKGKVTALLKALKNAPGDLTVEPVVSRRGEHPGVALEKARETPAILNPPGEEISGFRLKLSRHMGTAADSGKGSFIRSLRSLVEEFDSAVIEAFAKRTLGRVRQDRASAATGDRSRSPTRPSTSDGAQALESEQGREAGAAVLAE